MEAILAGTLPYLLLYGITTLTAGTTSTPTSEPIQVQNPFNLKMESYNFNTTLSWDYNIASIAPYFQVEYRIYRNKNGSWDVVEICRNISLYYCDLSEKIVDPYGYYRVRVKAFVGSEVSVSAETEFSLINDGIIGPPKLNASVDGKYINIDVWFPHVPHVNGKRNIGDYFEDLTYDIYYGNETEETNECDFEGCSANILIKENKHYCFSAQGKSKDDPITIERSKEICIDIAPPPNGISNKVIAIVIPIVLAVIVAFVLCVFIIKRNLQATSMLPLSLNTVAKVMTTHLPSDQIAKYDPVTVSPMDSPEEKRTPEEADKDLNVSDDSDIRVGIDTGYQSSAGETEQKSDDEQNGNKVSSSSSNNYYHTENDDSSFACIKECITEEEPLRDIKPITNSFGYDKPHCPL